MNSKQLRYFMRIILFGLGYCAAAWVGLTLKAPETNVTLLWPPSGVALAVLMLFGYRYWPGIFLGTLLTAITNGQPLIFGLVGGGISTLEAVLGVYLLRQANFNPSLTTTKDVLLLLIYGALLSTLIGALVEAAALCLSSSLGVAQCMPEWWGWWLGNAMGVLVFAPLIFAWHRWPQHSLSSFSYLEITASAVAVVIINYVIFGELLGKNSALYPLAYITLPLSIWAAIRVGQRGAATISTLIIGMAVWGTINNNGPFDRPSTSESLILIWVFMGVIIITALSVAAVIGERQHAKQALQDERDFALTVMNTLGQGVVVVTADGLIEYVNPATGRILGRPPEHFIGQINLDFIHPDDRHKLAAHVDIRRQGKPSTYELRIQHVDGNYVDVLLTGTPRIENGQYYGSIIVATDLTDRKRSERERLKAENALRDSEERYRIISQVISNIAYVYQVDEQQQFHRVWATEEAVTKVTGYTYSEIDTMGGFIALIHPEDRPNVETYHQALLAGESSNVEYRFTAKSGQIHWLQEFARPIWDHQKHRVTRIYGAAQDITNRKKLEKQLYQAQKLEAIGQLAGGIAHDFNNILTVIIGNSELLLDLVPEEEMLKKDIEQINKLGNRAAALTRQLLVFSRQQVLNPTLVNLNSIVNDMDHMLSRLIGEDIQMTVMLDSNLWQIKADPSQLEQVILNLAVNARDAMPNGGALTIETANFSMEIENSPAYVGLEPGNYVKLSVTDNGTGMDSDTLSHIFEPFYTTKETGKGTGLGLATIHGIVTQSGGQILVDSWPNKGTTFNIFLPATSQTLPKVNDHATQLPASQPTATILLVEDDDSVRDVVHRTLTGSGYTVLEADNGDTALQLAREHPTPIHLLLTDIVVPGKINGYQLARQLLQDLTDIKIIYMSGYTEQKLMEVSNALPEKFLLRKPFSTHLLLEVVQRVLQESPGKPD